MDNSDKPSYLLWPNRGANGQFLLVDSWSGNYFDLDTAKFMEPIARVEIVAANAGSVTVAIPTYRSTYGMISASSQCLLSTNFTAACLRKLRSLEVIPK